MTWPPRLDEDLRDRLLARLGWPSPPEPTTATLFALHRAFVERIPYESLWIALGETRTADPLDSVRYVMTPGGRGGYCYHMNGTLATLLSWLGYDVHRHVAGVQMAEPEPVGATGNHLVLTVRTADGDWLVDVGLGDGLHDPLPLTPGEYRQAPFTFGLDHSTVVPGGWRFTGDPRMTLVGFDFRSSDATTDEFADVHHTLSTSPDSLFVRFVVAFRRDATGVDMLRGAVLVRTHATDTTETFLTTSTDWFAALADTFGITLSTVDDERRGALWSRVHADHERWQAKRAQ